MKEIKTITRALQSKQLDAYHQILSFVVLKKNVCLSKLFLLGNFILLAKGRAPNVSSQTRIIVPKRFTLFANRD
jgi:hypothetical protein